MCSRKSHEVHREHPEKRATAAPCPRIMLASGVGEVATTLISRPGPARLPQARLRERLAERCRSRNRNPRRRGTPTPGHAHLMCVRGRPTLRCPLPPRCHLSVFPASSSSRDVEGLTHVRNSTN